MLLRDDGPAPRTLSPILVEILKVEVSDIEQMINPLERSGSRIRGAE